MLTEKQQDQLDEIMDHFDFGKVHKAMDATNWKWSLDEGINAVPNECQLRQAARRLITHAMINNVSISTGGFYASIDMDYPKLEFILSEYEVWSED